MRATRKSRQARYPPEKILSPHFRLSILPPPVSAPIGHDSMHFRQWTHGVSGSGEPGESSASVTTPPPPPPPVDRPLHSEPGRGHVDRDERGDGHRLVPLSLQPQRHCV